MYSTVSLHMDMDLFFVKFFPHLNSCIILSRVVSATQKVPTGYLFFFLNIIFIFHCARLSLLHGLSLAAVSGGYSPVAVSGLLIGVASLFAEHGL